MELLDQREKKAQRKGSVSAAADMIAWKQPNGNGYVCNWDCQCAEKERPYGRVVL